MFIESISYAFMSHFSAKPINILVKYRNPYVNEVKAIESWIEIKKHFNPVFLKKLKNLRSVESWFRNIFEKEKLKEPKDQDFAFVKILEDDDLFIEWTRERLDELHRYHLRQNIAFEILMDTQRLICVPTVQLSIRKLYSSSLNEDLGKHGKNKTKYSDHVKAVLLLLKYEQILII